MTSTVNKTPLQMEFFSKFSIHDPSDPKRCIVNRMAAISDGRVLVIDIGNYKLKLFSDEFIPIAAVDIPTLCCSLAVVDGTTIVVAGENRICFFKIENDSLHPMDKEITTNFTVFDIARVKKFFVCLGRIGDGNYLYKVEENGDARALVKLPPGDLTFSNSLAVNKDGTQMFINDDYSGKFNITCYSLKGEIKWNLQTDWMPACLTVIMERLFIADYARHTIRHVTIDGIEDKVPALTEDQDVHYPHALSYQSTKQRLLVSSRKHSQDAVTVYSFVE